LIGPLLVQPPAAAEAALRGDDAELAPLATRATTQANAVNNKITPERARATVTRDIVSSSADLLSGTD
jgi:hypothetical protein